MREARVINKIPKHNTKVNRHPFVSKTKTVKPDKNGRCWEKKFGKGNFLAFRK